MEKKLYESPLIEIIEIDSHIDTLTTSNLEEGDVLDMGSGDVERPTWGA